MVAAALAVAEYIADIGRDHQRRDQRAHCGGNSSKAASMSYLFFALNHSVTVCISNLVVSFFF